MNTRNLVIILIVVVVLVIGAVILVTPPASGGKSLTQADVDATAIAGAKGANP